jgi:hypothetical protein
LYLGNAEVNFSEPVTTIVRSKELLGYANF